MRSLVLAGILATGFTMAGFSPTRAAPPIDSALGKLKATGVVTIQIPNPPGQGKGPGWQCNCPRVIYTATQRFCLGLICCRQRPNGQRQCVTSQKAPW